MATRRKNVASSLFKPLGLPEEAAPMRRSPFDSVTMVSLWATGCDVSGSATKRSCADPALDAPFAGRQRLGCDRASPHLAPDRNEIPAIS